MWNALLDAGDPGEEVLHAFIVKEQLRRLLALPVNAGRELIRHRLWQFYQLAADCEIPEVHRLAETIETWWPAVEAAIITGYSNACVSYCTFCRGCDATGLAGLMAA